MKRIFFLLSLLGVVGLCFAQTVPNGLQYQTVNGSSVTITKYTGNATSVVIPNLIQGLPVTSIGEKAFFEKDITSVTIPNSVTSIGERAFYWCRSLTGITIPDSVTTIGESAFSFCRLTSVTIPNSVTSIGDWAFHNSGLTSVTIPNSITYIGKRTFDSNRLTSITIPNSVTIIGERAFSGNKITNITIVPRSGTGRFNPEGTRVVTSGTSSTVVDSLEGMPNSTIHIGYMAFESNPITSITLGDDVSLTSSNGTYDDAFGPNGFTKYYYAQNRKAGTFVLSNGEWKRQ